MGTIKKYNETFYINFDHSNIVSDVLNAHLVCLKSVWTNARGIWY